MLAQSADPFAGTAGQLAGLLVGNAPEVLDKLSYGERVMSGKGETLRPDPDLLDVVGLVPNPLKGVPAIKATAEAMAGLKMLPAMAGIFAGAKAKHADLVALQAAQTMERKGYTPAAIWDQTGWFKDEAGDWKWEINDQGAKFQPLAFERAAPSRENAYKPVVAPVEQAFSHDALFENYPELRELTLSMGKQPDWVPKEAESGLLQGKRLDVRAKTEGSARSIMLHELEHAVQDVEKFMRGGTQTEPMIQELAGGDPAKAYKLYRNLGGELSAANVQLRKDMSLGERQRYAPWETQKDLKDFQETINPKDLPELVRALRALNGR